MAIFQHVLWGYELTYPEDWVHNTIQDTECFAANAQAFQEDYIGPGSGQLLVRAEWNPERRPIGPLWRQHIGMVSGMLGAKQVGSSPWRMGGAVGMEAEIALPKQSNQRLWAGLLTHDLIVLKFSVVHPREERSQFEPTATHILSSLKFLTGIDNLASSDWGLPLPPGYSAAEPLSLIPDIADLENWQAYRGESGIDALQAFYHRELDHFGWQITEYIPFPGQADLGFARFQARKGAQAITLGLLPFGDKDLTASSPANLAFRRY